MMYRMTMPLPKWFIFATSLATVLVSSKAALAQSEQASDANDIDNANAAKVLRFSQNVKLDDDAHGSISVQMNRDDDGRNLPWSLHADSADATQTRLCAALLPDHAGERYYQYEIAHHLLEQNTHLVLFTGTSSVEAGAPPDMPTYQVAWLLSPVDERQSRRATSRIHWNCTLVASGNFTELDGGPRLHVDTEGAAPQLLRTDSKNVVEYCGLGNDEAVERYVVDRQRFIPHAKLEVLLKGARKLTAKTPKTRFMSPYLAGIYSWAWATSDIRSNPGALVTIRPRTLGDLDTKTAWAEGAKGLGTGEYVTASINELVPLQGFRIFPGNGSDSNTFQQYGRPTRLLVSFSDLTRFEIDIPGYDYATLDNKGGLFVAFPEPVTTSCMTVMLLDSMSGTSAPARRSPDYRQSVAISEITPVTTLESPSSRETAKNLIDFIASEPLLRRRDRLGQLMIGIETDAVAAIREALAEGPSERRVRVIPLLGQLPPGQSLPILLAAFEVTQPEDDEYRAIKRTIAMHGSHSTEKLSEFLENQGITDQKRIDIIRLIGRVATPVQLSLLVENLGQGSDFERRERLRAIVNGGATVFPALLTQTRREDTSAAASFDALRGIETLGRRLYIQQGAQLEGSELLLEAAKNAPSRTHRLSAIRALGYFRHEAALPYLAYDLLLKHPDPLIRRAAAQALGYYPDEQARTALEQALTDISPDVRIESMISLARKEDSEKSIPAVIQYARNETWTQGLHHAYSLLAREGSPQAMEFLSETLVQSIDTARAINIMRALKRHDRSLNVAVIKQLFKDPKTPFRARIQLVDLLGLDTTPAGEALLISIAQKQFPASDNETPEERELLFRQALMAIGHRRSQSGIEILFTIVRTETELDRRKVALRALGFYQDTAIASMLLAWYPEAPRELKPEVQSVINQIRNRVDIQQAVEGIDELIDALDEF